MAVPHVFLRVQRAGLWFLHVWPEALTWPPHLLQNYLPSQEGMAYNQFVKMMIIFSVAFITVLILKVNGACWVALGGTARRVDCLEAGRKVGVVRPENRVQFRSQSLERWWPTGGWRGKKTRHLRGSRQPGRFPWRRDGSRGT